jgi:hypothetical protein
MFLAGGLDDQSRCEVGIVIFPDCKALNSQAAQGLYEITLREEFARLNELTGSLTLTSGVQAAAGDKSIVDSLEGTVVWEYDSMACPQTIVRLYRGMMKAYVNQSNKYEGSTVVVEHQDKDQAAGLELTESFILCGHQAFKTHIKNIAVFIHKDDWMEVAQGHFNDKEGEGDLTQLESGMSFMQVRASMSMKEKLRQVRGAICVNRREIAHTGLEAIAGADNPYSLITIFGRGHLAIKAGGAVYVTRCSPLEVLPRSHKNCTVEIPITVNGTDAFVDPISYVIKSAVSPIHCFDVAPPPPLGTKWGASGTSVILSSRSATTQQCCQWTRSGSTPSKSKHRPGQEHLHPGAAGGVRPLPGQPGDQKGVPGGDGLQRVQREGRVWTRPQARCPRVINRYRGGQLLSTLQGGGTDDFLSVALAAGMGRVEANHYSSPESHNNSKMQGVRDMGSDGILGYLVSAGHLAL